MATRTVLLPSATALLTSSAASQVVADTWDCTLAWDMSGDPNVKGYILKWGINHSYATGQSDLLNASEYTIQGIPFDTTWYAAAFAVDNFNLESTPSNEVELFRPQPPPANASTVTIQISLNAADTKALYNALQLLYGSPAVLKHYIKLKL